MVFLTIEDLRARMFERFINESSDDAPDVLDIIEEQNIALFQSKLNARYDIDALFTATGTARHPLLVKYLSIFVLYDMIRRNAARKVPSDLVELREEAMKWLNDVRDGREEPFGFPDNPSDDATNPDVLWGNNHNDDFYL